MALRRGQNKAAVAVARKLTVAVWHVLQGHWNKALEETTTLLTKLTKLATELGVPTLRELGYASKPPSRSRNWRCCAPIPRMGNHGSPNPSSRGNIRLRSPNTPAKPTKNL